MESGRCIRKTKWHNKPFKRTIASSESSLPFVTFGNADKMISVSEIKGSIDTSFASCIEEVGNERKWIASFLCDFVECSKIDAESGGAILLSDKEYWRSVRGTGLSDETNA